MRLILLATLATVLCCDIGTQPPVDSAEDAIWWGGVFLGDGPWPADGETMIAAYHTPTGSLADSVVVRVRTVPNPCGPQATELMTPTDSAPFLLIRGLALAPGPITTVFNGYSFVVPDDTLRLMLNGTTYSLTADGEPDTVQTGGFLRYKLEIVSGGRRQLLLERAGVLDGPPHLRWGGDLDRDGRLDLLFDFRPGYAPSNRTLLLSARARPDSLVGTFASRTHPGC